MYYFRAEKWNLESCNRKLLYKDCREALLSSQVSFSKETKVSESEEAMQDVIIQALKSKARLLAKVNGHPTEDEKQTNKL